VDLVDEPKPVSSDVPSYNQMMILDATQPAKKEKRDPGRFVKPNL
jgi:hypothetical protein